MSTSALFETQAPLAALRQKSSILYAITTSFAGAFMICLILGQIDPHLFNGVGVWEKPAKFFLSLSIHAATLGLGMSLLSDARLVSKGVRSAAYIFALCAVVEMIWIAGYAAFGMASHFNSTDPIAMIIYPIMGVVAVTMTVVTGYLGLQILKSGESAMHRAAGYGFILSGALTVVVAGYMSSQTGHSVGGNLSAAQSLPFFHWSTTGGDLRVPHFAALHIAQALPFMAWIWPDKRVVTLTAILSIAVVAALFSQAVNGIPFLKT